MRLFRYNRIWATNTTVDDKTSIFNKVDDVFIDLSTLSKMFFKAVASRFSTVVTIIKNNFDPSP